MSEQRQSSSEESGQRVTPLNRAERAPQWYKDAIIYEIHLRAFADGNGDGIGDFRGLTEKLDYLQDLGVTALWLLPFYPSPLRDDGYDISDYTDIHPSYGTLSDFRAFLRAAHQRGLRVITELVVNHTSDQHPWFQRARRARPGSRARDFYVWCDSQEKYQDARVIFKDFETSNWAWDPLAKAYYWHRFYSHQPDLNFDNPAVQKALFNVLDFWLGLGVDGLRLDAVPYLYEREGTSCENLPETHAFLKQLRRHVDEHYRDRMLLAEANQWPEDAVAYFGAGDECHMAFHFPVMPRLFMAVHMEDRYPVIDILNQTPQIDESNQWALFLRNHDELTLEMVTDEDRDYMYQVYANDPQARINLGIRRRLAPLLGSNRRKMELLNSLLFSLPGTPVLYYGDEIGMGDNIYLGDRNGVRTPMQWSADRNAGFSGANPQRLYLPVIIDPEHHYETVNVEAQQQNLHSFLWWMKRLIVLRKRFQAFGRGTIEFLLPSNRKVLTFIRRNGDELILAIANLSRFVQYAELDLAAFKGMTPLELFGHTRFPQIGELPYFVTLSPHGFYWFKLEAAREKPAKTAAEVPTIEVSDSWEELFAGRNSEPLEEILPNYLAGCRWFGGKARAIRLVRVMDALPFRMENSVVYVTVVQVQYTEGQPEEYLLPIGFVSSERVAERHLSGSQAVIAQVTPKQPEGTGGCLYDATADGPFANALLDAIARRRVIKGGNYELSAVPARALRKLLAPPFIVPEASLRRGDQSNTSMIFGDRLILKYFRRVQAGINPDLEISRFLNEKTSFRHVPPLAGHLELRQGGKEPGVAAILHGWVVHEDNAWNYTLDSVKQFFEQCLARRRQPDELPLPRRHRVDLAEEEIPSSAQEMIGAYLASAGLLGQRIGELHVALASASGDPAFTPEPTTTHYRHSMYQSLRAGAHKTLMLLRERLSSLPESLRPQAAELLGAENRLMARYRLLLDRRITAARTRCHGDFHLGQVLYTGKDFVIIDFEGEPARSLGERRLKRPPLRDVAGMLRSFDYAAVVGVRNGSHRPEDLPVLEFWARYWNLWTSVAFLKRYFQAASHNGFLPKTKDELKFLLDILVLEKAVYELNYELNNRPDWVDVSLRGIFELLNRPEQA
jgi:maltose alpha-D-glucosyltransferase / alpha-amylase